MFQQLGTTWTVAAGVVIATVGIYLTFIALVRVVGQRSLASMSSFDFGCAVALGAVMGRTVLLATPTLVSGMIALASLFTIQGGLGLLRRYRPADRLINRRPVLLMAAARILPENLRRAQVTTDELRQRLRLAGITRLDEVGCAVLERNGSISVLRRDVDLDLELLSDVPDAHRLTAPGEELDDAAGPGGAIDRFPGRDGR
jgi:uncharacterized membrane protein YcaP (DUF421 family)